MAVTLPPIVSESWHNDPKHLGFVLARYKFVAKMLAGLSPVAEIGCGEGFASYIVTDHVDRLDLYDLAPGCLATKLDICVEPLPLAYRAIYAIDVLEHIRSEHRPPALTNICRSLEPDGVFIAGCPSIESQKYANARSKAGHVSCTNGEHFRAELMGYFNNVFMFGMNDEVLHTGFMPFCQYLFALCVGPR